MQVKAAMWNCRLKAYVLLDLRQEDTPMSRSIDLPDSVYTALEEAAAASGTTPAEWIEARLPQPAPAIEPECEGPPPRTLAERSEGYIGLFSSGATDLSERVGELYGEGMVEKHRARQLQAHQETATGTSVDLSACIYAALQEAASASGTTPEGWIAANLPLPALTVQPEPEGPSSLTLAERFAAHVGGFRSGRGDLSERHSELFTEGLVEKRRTGTL
jgi:hypothetical protein